MVVRTTLCLTLFLTYLDSSNVRAFTTALRCRGDTSVPQKRLGSRQFKALSEYQPLDGEKRINLKIDLDTQKVANNEELTSGEKKVFCRCWLSGTFPLCDGAHVKHNAATNDNVGPLIVSVPSIKSKTQSLPDIVSPSKTIVEGRKSRVLWGYRITALSYLFYAMRYFSVKGIQPFSIQVNSGYALAAGLAYILASAVQGNRLSSDTYKRLNLSLLQFGLFGIWGWGLVKFSDSIPGFTPMLLPPLFAMINGIKGYGYGVLGVDKAGNVSFVNDLSQGIKSTIQGMFSLPKNIKAAGYLAATYMLTGIKFTKLVEIVRLIAAGSDGLVVFTRLSRYARYAMLWTVLYTLKDAADRGRLEGTTFIELNFLSAVALAALAAFTGIASPIGSGAAAFALFSTWNGISSIAKKRQS